MKKLVQNGFSFHFQTSTHAFHWGRRHLCEKAVSVAIGIKNVFFSFLIMCFFSHRYLVSGRFFRFDVLIEYFSHLCIFYYTVYVLFSAFFCWIWWIFISHMNLIFWSSNSQQISPLVYIWLFVDWRFAFL